MKEKRKLIFRVGALLLVLLIAAAMMKTGLDKRIALFILSKIEHLTSQMEESAVTLLDILTKRQMRTQR